MRRRSLLKTLGLAAGGRLAAASVPLFAQAGENPHPGPEPHILLNQVGYRPGQSKVATVRGLAGGDGSFRLRAIHGNAVVYKGTLSGSRIDAASGDTVQQADFSAFNRPGTFVLETAGQASDPVVIGNRVYAEALRSTMRAFYGQRCGCAVDLGNGFRHPPCHAHGEFHPTSGKSGPLPNRGGWHDAGDYGRYIVNSGITCGTLLWAWEMFPTALGKLPLGIPKQHGSLPDFLEEVLWNLDWMLQLQDGDGGVFQKQTSTRFCAFIMPQDDQLPSEVIGTGAPPFKSTAATADFAAVMTIAARCYRHYDRALADQMQTAAEKAWTWAMAHPDVVFHNPKGVSTGDYGDNQVSDELLWASAELWRTTGEEQYEQAFLKGLPAPGDLKIDAPSWGGVRPLACWAYLLSPRLGDARVRAAIREQTEAAAQALIANTKANGYGNTLFERDYIWGSNSVAANQSLLLVVAHRLQPGPESSAAALNNLHYLLGRNCHGVSWVTQVGTRPFQHPHHRPSAADGIAAPWPGLLSGGPNHGRGDAVAAKLPDLPPMRMWVDDQNAYSLNEIAINWNAPLVFLLAFANSTD